MSTSEDTSLETLRRIEDDFADAMTRMYAVGNELSRLRSRLSAQAAPAPATTTSTPPVAASTSPVTPGQVAAPPVTTPVAAPPIAPLPVTPLPPTEPWWQRDGLVAKLLAVVGTAITLIGIAFLLALAIQMGFFGPLARVVSGALLALALVGAALLVHRRPSGTIGALGLAATGIAAGYLDVLAVTRIYAWVPLAIGMVIAGLIALGGVLLARAWDSQLLAVVAVLGVALMAPFVGLEHGLLTGGFLLVLAAATWPAQIGRRWWVLELARIVPTALFLTALAAAHDRAGITALLGILLAVLVLGTSLAGVVLARPPRALGVLMTVAVAPASVSGLVLDDRWTGAGLLLLLACLLVLVAGLADEAPQTPIHLRLTEVALGTAGLVSLLAVLRAGSGGWTPVLGVLLCLAWAVGGLALRHRATLVVALALSGLGLLGSLSLLPLVLLRGQAHSAEPRHLIATLGLTLLCALLAHAVTTTLPQLAPVLPRALLAVALLWVAGSIVIAGALVGGLLHDRSGGFTAGQAGATVVWMSTAAALLTRGLRGSEFAVPAGLALAALAVGKLLLFDLSFLGGIARVLSFIVAGLLLLGMGAGYAQALARTRRGQAPPAVENPAVASPLPPTV